MSKIVLMAVVFFMISGASFASTGGGLEIETPPQDTCIETGLSHSWLQKKISQYLLGGEQRTLISGESSLSREHAKLYLPLNYDKIVSKGRKIPLLLLLHGLEVTGSMQLWLLGVLSEISKEGKEFILLVPEGTVAVDRSTPYLKTFFWSTTFWDINDTAKTKDEDYLLALIEEVKQSYSVDLSRVYAFGHSNGGFMAHQLACNASTVFAGIVSFAGTMLEDFACNPVSPVSILQIHSQDDSLVNYQGGKRKIDGREISYIGAEAVIKKWETLNGCSKKKQPKVIHSNC